jgi:hypothetical protein
MKHKHKMAKAKRAEGGKVKANEYNAQGSPEAKEAKDETAEFKRGGKMKEGGHVYGHKSAKRLDKRARGGRTGHSPYSSAKGGSDYEKGGAGNGREMNSPSVD